MITKQDKNLIEKFLDHKLELPDAKPLTSEEEEIFNQRINDSEFKNHLKLSDEVNEAIIEHTEEAAFKKTLNKIMNT
ncbi:MAG: hypothetical protein WCL02_06010 [bacterium]